MECVKNGIKIVSTHSIYATNEEDAIRHLKELYKDGWKPAGEIKSRKALGKIKLLNNKKQVKP